jgi:hypothetical protein
MSIHHVRLPDLLRVRIQEFKHPIGRKGRVSRYAINGSEVPLPVRQGILDKFPIVGPMAVSGFGGPRFHRGSGASQLTPLVGLWAMHSPTS